MTDNITPIDIAIIGAGAAGLAAGIFAGEAARERNTTLRIVLLDSAKKPGAKILVSGGGRCNVTNVKVTPGDFNGGPQPMIRSVLKAFDEHRTREWMTGLGVELKVEPTGKLFPVTDKALTVLDALLAAARKAGVELQAAKRVRGITRNAEGLWEIATDDEPLLARTVIIATGGRSLPKSGSDGAGLEWLRGLGHTIVPTTPALSPLTLAPGPDPWGWFEEMSGLTVEARLEVCEPSGKRQAAVEGAVLLTHFGISGPAAMDVSRHWLQARRAKLTPQLLLAVPKFADVHAAEAHLLKLAERQSKTTVAVLLRDYFPRRIAERLAGNLGAIGTLRREDRHRVARMLGGWPLPVLDARGWSFAETTAGGVSLREVDVRTMASRKQPGLYLCGELLDVDGRIGGFNFQWAWASGHLAGRAAAAEVCTGL